MKIFFPILFLELYLIFTLLLFFFGPIQFQLHNPILFIMTLSTYHIASILGYYIGLKSFKFSTKNYDKALTGKQFYTGFFFAVLAVLLSYQNIMLSNTFVPYNLFSDVYEGLIDPAEAYAERIQAGAADVKGASSYRRTINILSLLFAFFKLYFIFFVCYFWSGFSFIQKTLSISYFCLFLSPGFASGANSVIFKFFIFSITSSLIIVYFRSPEIFKRIAVVLGISFLIPIGFFGYIMSRRGGGFEYFEQTAPQGEIVVSATSSSLSGFFEFYYYSFVWLTYYLVQGYYGFSLILSRDWNWTFGFGSSDFLQRQLLKLTGIDITDITFQAQISDQWSSAQWHSFYGHFANDFGFVGLSSLMFFIGFFLARVWASIIYNDSFYGKCLIPIFTLMFIFFPANNQVFGYIDTLSYFVCLSILWIFERNNLRH